MKKNIICMAVVLLLPACSSVNTTQNQRLDSLAEKVDALLVYNNKTYDILVDNELRISELEKDAKKRGVPVPQKLVSVENLPQNAMQLKASQDAETMQTKTAGQPVSSAENMEKQQNLSEQSAKDIVPNHVGAITGQDLTQAEEIVQKNIKSNVTEAPMQEVEQTASQEQDVKQAQAEKDTQSASAEQKNVLQPIVKDAEKQPVSKPVLEISPKSEKVAVSAVELQKTQQTDQKGQVPTQKLASKDMYNKAYTLYQQRQYAKAEKAFEEFLAQYPQDVLAPNALYWKGETLYARALYPQAIFAFKEVQTRYPKNPKTADSLLKTAMCYARLGDNENASLHFLVLMEDWPQSEAAAKARTMGAK